MRHQCSSLACARLHTHSRNLVSLSVVNRQDFIFITRLAASTAMVCRMRTTAPRTSSPLPGGVLGPGGVCVQANTSRWVRFRVFRSCCFVICRPTISPVPNLAETSPGRNTHADKTKHAGPQLVVAQPCEGSLAVRAGWATDLSRIKLEQGAPSGLARLRAVRACCSVPCCESSTGQ